MGDLVKSSSTMNYLSSSSNSGMMFGDPYTFQDAKMKELASAKEAEGIFSEIQKGWSVNQMFRLLRTHLQKNMN